MSESTGIANAGPPDGQPPDQLVRVSLLRILLSWVCFGTGDLVSRFIEPLLGRWYEWPYRIYNMLMTCSSDLQSNDARGPWDLYKTAAEECPRV
jgi:hypothetical protein